MTAWTIDELGAQIALALSADQPDMPNGRIREVPDLRTIRYYTTLGLIDRPLEMRGRTALYGRRHLLQLVAIKRLQARGLSLAEIQERVVGQTDAALGRLAQMPAEQSTREPKATQDEPRRQAFWSAIPEPPPPESEPASTNLSWQGVSMAEGLLLLFEPTRPLDEDDVAALRTAAAPLLKLMHTRRLLRPRKER